MTEEKENFIKKILYFYLYKEKVISHDYKYVLFKRSIIDIYDDELSDFDKLCNNNIILLETNLNKIDSRTVYLLFRFLFDYQTEYYFECINIYLIPAILKKENIVVDYNTDLEKHNINIYDLDKYFNEWIYYTNYLYTKDEFFVIEGNIIPQVELYNDHPFLNKLNMALFDTQKIFTIKDIINDDY
jgi:hypothetical protein